VCQAVEGAGNGELLLCSGCMGVRYCSRECKKQHWKQHKNFCKRGDNRRSSRSSLSRSDHLSARAAAAAAADMRFCKRIRSRSSSSSSWTFATLAELRMTSIRGVCDDDSALSEWLVCVLLCAAGEHPHGLPVFPVARIVFFACLGKEQPASGMSVEVIVPQHWLACHCTNNMYSAQHYKLVHICT
jgi:hypothetical protein